MKTLLNVFAVALLALVAQTAQAADCAAKAAPGCGADPASCNAGCNGNGCGGCGKTCKLVSTTKKIVVTCYGAKEEHLCIPGPSCKGCENCESLCAKPGCACDCGDGCRPDCHVKWNDWCPGDAQMYCRKKLVKYEAVKEVPWFKWVVVDCDANGCEMGAPAKQPMPGAPPAPPKAALTRPAPAGAVTGMEFEVSEQEMKQLQTQVASPASAPATPAVAPKTSGISKLVEFIR